MTASRLLGAVPPTGAAPLHAFDCLAVERASGGAIALRADKRVEATDPYLDAHFPQLTIYPGVFVLETVVQAAAAAIRDRHGREVRLAAVCSMRFLAPLLGGDTLALNADVVSADAGGAWRVEACCRRADGTVCALLTIELASAEAIGA